MNKPMTAEEAREAAERAEKGVRFPNKDEHIPATLRAYADMLDRRSDDVREAVYDEIMGQHVPDPIDGCMISPLDPKDAYEVTDRIMALFPQGVRVKALNFYEAGERAWECGHHSAAQPSYRIVASDDLPLAPYRLLIGARELDGHPTLEAAKAAAQAHYDDAIREAIEPQDVSGLVEALERIEIHIAAIGIPKNKAGEYDKFGEWSFSEACPRKPDAKEIENAFDEVRHALAAYKGGQ